MNQPWTSSGSGALSPVLSLLCQRGKGLTAPLHPSYSAFLSACPSSHIATEPLSQVRSLPEPLQEPSSCRQLCLSPLRVSPGLGHWQERSCSRQQRWVHDAADEVSLTQLMKGPISRDSSTGHGNHQAMTSPSHQERKTWETPTCPTWKPWVMFSACPNRTFQQEPLHSEVLCAQSGPAPALH